MPLFSQEKTTPKTKLPEVVAVDFAASGLKLVRAKPTRNGATIVNLGFLPDTLLEESPVDGSGNNEVRLGLPKEWSSHYVAMAISGGDSVIRYVSLPGRVERSPKVEQQLREHMGLEGEYRLSCVVTPQARRKAETRLLAAALPEEGAQALLSRVSAGNPAPVSLEISSLAALNAFSCFGPGSRHGGDAIGFIECGASVTLVALFNKGGLVLARKFNMGGNALAERVQKQMGVDREVAHGIISDGSFDISQAVQEVMRPFLRQISISKDFVERRESCQISMLYVSGGMSLSRYWVECIKSTVGVETRQWNPFEDFNIAEGACPDEIAGQGARFAAALGAAAAAFGES